MLYIAILLALWLLTHIWLANKTSPDALRSLTSEAYAKEAESYPFYQIYAYNLVSTQYNEKEWIKSIIISKAREFHIDENLVLRIVSAESGFQPDVKNKTSSASGIAQFLNSTFKNFCIDKYHLTETMADKNDPHIQAECMVRMIADGKISHWNASRKNW